MGSNRLRCDSDLSVAIPTTFIATVTALYSHMKLREVYKGTHPMAEMLVPIGVGLVSGSAALVGINGVKRSNSDSVNTR